MLPFRVIYWISDGLFVLIYYVWRYRKKVAYENLVQSFPDKSPNEIKSLRRKYFHYLCDLFLETFKMLTISRRSMLRHCKLDEESQKLLNKLFEQKESSILTLGHKGNWEWAGHTVSLRSPLPFYIIYHSLAKVRFDKLMYKMRSRFGAGLIPMANAFKGLKKLGNGPMLSAFVADQSPPPATAYWTEFLNQETGFFRGPEKISAKLGQSVLYLSIQRLKRGYYNLHIEMLANSHEHVPEGEITERYIRTLEKDIRSQPETWLWSHRRWKHKNAKA